MPSRSHPGLHKSVVLINHRRPMMASFCRTRKLYISKAGMIHRPWSASMIYAHWLWARMKTAHHSFSISEIHVSR